MVQLLGTKLSLGLRKTQLEQSLWKHNSFRVYDANFLFGLIKICH